ncbi:glycosyl hydrolase [Chitinophaga sp. GbtcB8]|uniref:glycosyl hydrolase n=1 Tax=Chitinophaga sp. GbtcB8 TaxID=2824753 RepID=UPI001C2F9619|nr:glycosyl hydrolase [Chitinophaga sp. GbtcB8]
MPFIKQVNTIRSLILLTSLTLSACVAKKQLSSNNTVKPLSGLEAVFTNIPDTVQTSIYWYWISDNISKEGVIRDLESMKKVGINRAFIGNIWQDDVPAGKVKIFTPEWWDILHAALKKATELNIEIGIFNSPGWSQSGGPWVKPEQAMRYLTTTSIMVKGPAKFSRKLDQPVKDFQDVRLIAYPADPLFEENIANKKTVLTSAPALDGLNKLLDGNDTIGIVLTHSAPYTINITLEQPYTVRSLVIVPNRNEMSLSGELQAKINGAYTTIKHFTIDRSNSQLNVGFNPYGPGAVALPVTTSQNFRLVLNKYSNNCGIAEIRLSPKQVVEDYIEKTFAKMWQTPFPYWNAYQWAPALVATGNEGVIDPAKVIDISRYLAADGTLTWDVPAGNWMIERSGMTPTQVRNAPASPEGTGLEADKMSKEHIKAHFDAYLGEILRRIPAEDRKTWKVTVEDSYETGGQNWTDDFIEKFKKTYAYDPVPYIPVMQGSVVGSADQSDRFLWDVRRLIADNVAYEYVGGLREISHQHGLRTWLENYGHWGFPGEFLQYGGQSDEIGGEFWSEGMLGDIENRAASSAAHIYGKTKVSAESFTCAGAPFSRYPAVMKQRADRFFTEGINNTLLHVYISQPADNKAPGLNAFFGNEFNRLNTWFYDMDIFLKYIKRCNMMLQQGKYVADVAYFIGEDAPKMTGTQDPKLPNGYSFDYINAEVIQTRLSISNGKLTLPDGLSYSILVLPPLTTIRPALLKKIKELVLAGAVVLGPKPATSPSLENYPAADQEVARLAGELWGNIDGNTVKINKVGKGMILSGMDLQQALNLVNVKPDFKVTSTDPVLFIHRDLKEGQVYFISNQENSSINIQPEFRVSGLVPECWDPVSGGRQVIEQYSTTAGSTVVPMQLAPMESAFVVFRKKTSGPVNTLASTAPSPAAIAINTPWSVKFDEKMGGPLNAVKFDSLTDWSVHPNDSIRYYSGAAVYRNSFTWQGTGKASQVFLDLGMVKAIAKVRINDVEVGGVWTAPYKVDITAALKPGKNTITIKVVNTWVNRLIGDSELPVTKRSTWTIHNPYNNKSALQSSGLLGPVKLEVKDRSIPGQYQK